MKGEDVVILLKLFQGIPDWTTRGIESATRVPRSSVHRALGRLERAGLIGGQRLNVSRSEEFLVHAVKYVFPPEFGGMVRGVPTAWAAAPLSDELAIEGDDVPFVWPHPTGGVRGVALTPLHPVVPALAIEDEEMAARLALLDGIRVGDARVGALAERLLVAKLEAVLA